MPDQEFLPRWIRANGLDFAYLEAGAGPLVLCLHGFPDSAWSMRPLLRALAAAGFRAVAPFMRGYAPTSLAPDGDYRLTTLGRDVIALAEHLGGEQAFLVGHDWGAVATYAAASLRPDRFPRVVTAAIPHLRRFVLGPSLRQLHRSRYMGFFQLRGLAERQVTANDFAYIESLIHEWSPDWRYTAEDLLPLKAMWADPARLRAALAYYRAIPRTLLQSEAWRSFMQPLAVPARVIYGDRDGCIGPEMFQGMDRLFSAGLDLHAMPEAGHFMHCERPAEFAQAVIGFLRAG